MPRVIEWFDQCFKLSFLFCKHENPYFSCKYTSSDCFSISLHIRHVFPPTHTLLNGSKINLLMSITSCQLVKDSMFNLKQGNICVGQLTRLGRLNCDITIFQFQDLAIMKFWRNSWQTKIFKRNISEMCWAWIMMYQVYKIILILYCFVIEITVLKKRHYTFSVTALELVGWSWRHFTQFSCPYQFAPNIISLQYA